MKITIGKKLEESLHAFYATHLKNGIDAIGTDEQRVDVPIARYIDHTILKPDATIGDIRRLCDEAREYSFASVCVHPSFVADSAGFLAGSGVPVCSVIGFPLGANTTEIKVAETEQVIHNGAGEVDMVLHIGMLKSGEYDYVHSDIAHVTEAAHRSDVTVKVIIETALLTDDEKIKACFLSQWAGADFVKTSTGFSKSGATVRDIRLMRKIVGHALGVKASGGIRTLRDAEDMIRNGATRIGTSSGVAIARSATTTGTNNK